MANFFTGILLHGHLLHWHPHIHVLVTCGALTPEGDFLELPEFDLERLLAAWQDAVFALYLAEELYLAEDKIEPEVVDNMRTWHGHRRAAMVGGFSVDQSVFLPAGDQQGLERLIQCRARRPREPSGH
ncbi:MAG: transposase [Planctomycetota bacterium]|nr:transposase [Planctomycetota bacterium]